MKFKNKNAINKLHEVNKRITANLKSINKIKIYEKLYIKYSNPKNKLELFLLLLLVSGARYSELLNIKYNDISKTNHIFIYQSKTDCLRIIYFPEVRRFINGHTINSRDYFFRLNESTLRNYFKEFGYFIPALAGHRNKSVLHSFRAFYADYFSTNINYQDKIVIGLLGHKSKKSIISYLRRLSNG